MAICEFKGCGAEFKRENPMQRYCKLQECIEARVRLRYEKKTDGKFPKKTVMGKKKFCIKACWRKTLNRFGICNACRSYILTNYNHDFIEMIEAE